ncbi:coiled-coil domain-containing protein 169-like [Argonauta hians]
MAMDIVSEFELEKLRAEIEQEKQTKGILENSLQELLTTVKELEDRSEGVKDEGNEWRTRCETQEEMNKQLRQQGAILTEKVEEARNNLREAMKKPRGTNPQENIEMTPQYVKMLEKEKNNLTNQLRDMEWRLDQESKAYHKANDERKQYLLEINITKSTLEDLKMRQRYSNITSQYANNTAIPPLYEHNEQLNSLKRDGDGNIRENHRVLNARKGPIKKTAGIRNLPNLDQDGS